MCRASGTHHLPTVLKNSRHRKRFFVGPRRSPRRPAASGPGKRFYTAEGEKGTGAERRGAEAARREKRDDPVAVGVRRRIAGKEDRISNHAGRAADESRGNRHSRHFRHRGDKK